MQKEKGGILRYLHRNSGIASLLFRTHFDFVCCVSVALCAAAARGCARGGGGSRAELRALCSIRIAALVGVHFIRHIAVSFLHVRRIRICDSDYGVDLEAAIGQP